MPAVKAITSGRRRPDLYDEAPDFTWDDVQPGDYWKQRDGHWHVTSPRGESGGVVDSKWKVEEHADGTITVAPSIWFNRQRNGWHGYLEQGQWREI